jgi:hypothetical protein
LNRLIGFFAWQALFTLARSVFLNQDSATTERRDVFKSENLKELPAALIAMQADLRPIRKDEDGARGKYASLTTVMTAVRPILEKHGFSLVQTTMGNGHGAALQTVLMYKNGEFISSTIDVPVAKPNDPQAYGSALTYGRRYSIMALLGLVTEDDDAQSATVTLEDRCAEIFAATNLDDLRSADMRHSTALALTKTEKWVIRACVKAMTESLSA